MTCADAAEGCAPPILGTPRACVRNGANGSAPGLPVPALTDGLGTPVVNRAGAMVVHRRLPPAPWLRVQRPGHRVHRVVDGVQRPTGPLDDLRCHRALDGTPRVHRPADPTRHEQTRQELHGDRLLLSKWGRHGGPCHCLVGPCAEAVTGPAHHGPPQGGHLGVAKASRTRNVSDLFSCSRWESPIALTPPRGT